MAKCHQNYTALLQVLQNAVRDSHATRDSHVLRDLIRDLCQENPLEEGRPLVQRHEGIYEQIRRNQDSPLRQYPTLSGEDVQAAAKAQGMLHLQQLDEIESGFQGVTLPPRSADVDDMLVSHCDVEISFPGHGQDVVAQGPRMFLDINPATGFVEMGHIAATSYTLNYLQTMALQLVCGFLDRYTTDPDSAGQHLQYTGGPGGQPHLLQVTGTSGSAAARIGGTTIHSACGLDAHRSPNKPPPPFSEAKKWAWKQKLVLVIDEVSMLGGTTLYDVSRHLQSLRDCLDKPFGSIPVILLMGDFHQFAPVRETSLLVDRMLDEAHAPLRQSTISHHRGCSLWHMFKTVVLLEEQVRTRDDPQLGALLDRVRAGMQTQQDLVLLNTKLLDRSQITFHSGLRAITPLNRNRWSLNMEAVVDWARFNKRHISVFISATRPTPGEVARCLES
ncbi:PIF1-like helicase domain-containing protein [Hirsutella rhossiliensis]|uniref:ATP-dependent DNA helicase n=1 Tax=Hirsutella rhossiliensis TaxID=111463 RepID=A0A9P8SCK9_9HYPO|nr:PIF1-like helicase domain-containing protein [Hirsutella rhossiliensis]KAH0957004.1 PIF1-like helicase domain-containing protein [Hirsutella rhossiliensis]